MAQAHRLPLPLLLKVAAVVAAAHTCNAPFLRLILRLRKL